MFAKLLFQRTNGFFCEMNLMQIKHWEENLLGNLSWFFRVNLFKESFQFSFHIVGFKFEINLGNCWLCDRDSRSETVKKFKTYFEDTDIIQN